MKELTKEEYLQAVRMGVQDALLTMTESGDGHTGDIIREPFLESIREGVYDAFWALFTHATHMPCADFYDSIQKGVKEGIQDLEFNIIQKDKEDD